MDRQNGGENWGGANGAFDANASFSQNWLETDGTTEPVGGAPRVVGRLPNVSGNDKSEISLKSEKSSRRPAVRTAGVAVAAFGLGVVATLGGAACWNGFGNSANSGAVAQVGATSDAESTVAASENGANGDLASDSLAEITSSTLRSVPEDGAFGDASGSFPESLSDEIFSVNRDFNGFDAQSPVASTNGGAANSANSANSAGSPFPAETSSLADEIVRPGSRRNVAPTNANGWNGNNGGALENRPTQIADVPGTVVAEREVYPTWEDLEADAARGRAVAAQNPQFAQVPQAAPVAQDSQFAQVPQTAPVAQDSQFAQVPQTAPVAPDSQFAQVPQTAPVDYWTNAPTNANVPQVAAQNSPFPQIAQTAQNPNVAAPQASDVGGYYAANVPQNAQIPQTPQAANVANAPVAANYPQVANDFPTVGDYASANPVNPGVSGGFENFANPVNPGVSGGFGDSANSVGGAYSAYPADANGSASVDDSAQRRFVAQVPAEPTPTNATRYPSQNSAPVAAPARNLRW